MSNAGIRVVGTRKGNFIQPTPTQRLAAIARILEAVDQRCMAADGPVSKTREEITDDELRNIYRLATENRFRIGAR